MGSKAVRAGGLTLPPADGGIEWSSKGSARDKGELACLAAQVPLRPRSIGPCLVGMHEGACPAYLGLQDLHNIGQQWDDLKESGEDTVGMVSQKPEILGQTYDSLQ